MTAVRVEKSYEDPSVLTADEVVFDITNFDEFVLGARERVIDAWYAVQQRGDDDRAKTAADYHASMLKALDTPESWPFVVTGKKGEPELEVDEDETIILPAATVAEILLHITTHERAERYRAMEARFSTIPGVTLERESLLAVGGPLYFYRSMYQELPIGFTSPIAWGWQTDVETERLTGHIDRRIEAAQRYGKFGTVALSRAASVYLAKTFSEQAAEEQIFLDAAMIEYRANRWLAMDRA